MRDGRWTNDGRDDGRRGMDEDEGKAEAMGRCQVRDEDHQDEDGDEAEEMAMQQALYRTFCLPSSPFSRLPLLFFHLPPLHLHLPPSSTLVISPLSMLYSSILSSSSSIIHRSSPPPYLPSSPSPPPYLLPLSSHPPSLTLHWSLFLLCLFFCSSFLRFLFTHSYLVYL
eukprot:m.46375 g.46375  ORF g.46375 m.46375 type:complete len:169 (+) comp12242_c0_seq1:155-661(+)